jgi:hypothetical protein
VSAGSRPRSSSVDPSGASMALLRDLRNAKPPPDAASVAASANDNGDLDHSEEA